MKLCFVCSAGGHFTEALRLYQDLECNGFFITFPSENLVGRKERIYRVVDVRRNPLRFFMAFFQILFILLKEGVDVVISTGAGLAVPACYIGKIMGKKVVHLEIGCNVTRPSFSGRLIYHIADLFIVEWKGLLKYYPKAKYGGLLI
ncbi:MAG: hypothetical protein DRP11_03025 [Candidatus Aenigmatarchaeota archaeon]|nr:MAG: hypothetical protein DRP11_03025 [Candidatus Aenigmarchaeota archaeon]